MQEKILIFDFGSQYTQLIARRIRELNVYCEILPYYKIADCRLQIADCKGIILSGSPYSVRDAKSPHPDLTFIKNKFPLLGICYGAQLLAQQSGGEVLPSKIREYGRANLSFVEKKNKLFKGISRHSQVWMSHGDTISRVSEDYKIIASTKDVHVAGFVSQINPDLSGLCYGIQFHPEVYHTTEGAKLLKNFVVDICGCSQNWTPASFVETTVLNLKEKIKKDKVVLGLSGGVDSTVAAVLLNKAIHKNLYCIFIDNGLLRKNEFENVLSQYLGMGLNVRGIDAKEIFLKRLKGVRDPERKRKIIGKTFIDVFQKEIKKIKKSEIRDPKSEIPFWLAQGTIYPDVIESISVNGPSATIKSHHNVGGLPEKMKLKIVEPLNLLFKDEVRRVGKTLGLNDDLLGRHPFPGPGLSIRILGEITKEKIRILQEADFIFTEGLRSAGLYDKVWQAGAIYLPVQSVGVMGDERTYENAIALRAVTSTDGMTADWCHLPYEFLAKISNEIINKVKGINRVVYDISSKPPATIEWE